MKPLFGAVVLPIRAFFRLEAASAILLFVSAVIALIAANTGLASSYHALFETRLAFAAGDLHVELTIAELISDGLMTLFFFVVGMEIKREVAVGELSSFSKALLPAIAAIGGMLLPASIYFLINRGTPGEPGWGVPMATDIAFSIGCLTLFKKRVPHALFVFLTALAIFDDIGGILVIALFYGHGLNVTALLFAGLITAALIGAGRLRVASGFVYMLLGAGLWYALHRAGVHATIAGVIAGLTIPARASRPTKEILREPLLIEEKLEELESPLDRFVHLLHPYVAFGVMPLFALASSGVKIAGIDAGHLLGPVSLGVVGGLVAGKTIGIFVATWIAVKLRIASSPGGASLGKLFGVSAVGGIGFTVALFIAGLAFRDAPELLEQAKIGILAGSLGAGLLGCLVLRMTPVISGK
jgi:Na+:H+ antiporter, NhaA family